MIRSFGIIHQAERLEPGWPRSPGLIMTLTFTLGAGMLVRDDPRRRARLPDRDHRLQRCVGNHRRRILRERPGLRTRAHGATRREAVRRAGTEGLPPRSSPRSSTSSSNSRSPPASAPTCLNAWRACAFPSAGTQSRVRISTAPSQLLAGGLRSIPAALPFLVIQEESDRAARLQRNPGPAAVRGRLPLGPLHRFASLAHGVDLHGCRSRAGRYCNFAGRPSYAASPSFIHSTRSVRRPPGRPGRRRVRPHRTRAARRSRRRRSGPAAGPPLA